MIPTKRYKGRFRVEFVACLPEITALIAKGYTARMVFDDFSINSKITMCYSQFCRYIRTELPSQAKKQNPKAHTPAQGATKPQLPENAKSGFSIPRIADSTLQGDTRSVESLINGNGNIS